MGSPITFSGFNNIDFGSILNAIMTAERAPLTALETQKTTLNQQGTAFTTLASKLGALRIGSRHAGRQHQGSTPTPSPAAAPSMSEPRPPAAASPASTRSLFPNWHARRSWHRPRPTRAPDEVVATGGSLSVALYGNPPVNIPPTALPGR